ncbi:MAG: acireductone synthase [Pirellulaceae bacterium]|nr:acireductone synthase [Pirellulaceae bacterium]
MVFSSKMFFSGNGILLDIEGTTSSISFVYDVMFPFVRRELEKFLQNHWHEDGLDAVREQMAKDSGYSSFESWLSASGSESPQACLQQEAIRLMDDDVKATGLKKLQGLIWKSGFESGELCAHVYDDVYPALNRWQNNQIDIRIFSSGSIQAQKLFFGHTTKGDLLHYFQAHYDTTIGSKRDADSYRTIANQFGLEPDQVLFVSDVTAELDAAREARMATLLCVRPGNPPQSTQSGHEEIRSLDAIGIGS